MAKHSLRSMFPSALQFERGSPIEGTEDSELLQHATLEMFYQLDVAFSNGFLSRRVVIRSWPPRRQSCTAFAHQTMRDRPMRKHPRTRISSPVSLGQMHRPVLPTINGTLGQQFHHSSLGRKSAPHSIKYSPNCQVSGENRCTAYMPQ